MRYRPEIDGFPVILFHAGFVFFNGGFVGVDVFFVISGYLITSILIADLDANSFSIVKFYERRARRILPALFFVMFVSLPFAWGLLFPDAMKSFSDSLIGVSLFCSNFQFLSESDYFAATSELKPLIHTWSLAVEEQFYLVFPALLFSADLSVPDLFGLFPYFPDFAFGLLSVFLLLIYLQAPLAFDRLDIYEYLLRLNARHRPSGSAHNGWQKY